MSMNIFERASRSKVRFQTRKGLISTEDLWDLSLKHLDSMAGSINQEIEKLGSKSFLSDASTPQSSEMQLKLDLLIHVIRSKEQQNKAAETRASNMRQRAALEQILSEKRNEELKGKSVEEIQAMIDQL